MEKIQRLARMTPSRAGGPVPRKPSRDAASRAIFRSREPADLTVLALADLSSESVTIPHLRTPPIFIRAGGDSPERGKRHAAGHSASYC